MLETHQNILNYSYYFSAGEMEFGIDGPELINDKVYISIYHYLQYSKLKPAKYNTFSLGNYLTSKSSYYAECKYKSQSFSINKFDLELIESELHAFDNYLK